MNTLYKQTNIHTIKPIHITNHLSNNIGKQHENKYAWLCYDFTYGNYYD